MSSTESEGLSKAGHILSGIYNCTKHGNRQIGNAKTAHLHCTLRFYNCTNCDQLHIKICPAFQLSKYAQNQRKCPPKPNSLPQFFLASSLPLALAELATCTCTSTDMGHESHDSTLVGPTVLDCNALSTSSSRPRL